jgi:Tfp pilus assembly protein PilN
MHTEYNPSDRAHFILQEFERTLGYFESNYPDITLNKSTPLFLTGKLTGEGDLAQMVAAGVGFSVKTLGSSLIYPADFPIAQYAVNIGLALKNSSGKRSASQNGFLVTDIDIMPQEYLPKGFTTKQALAVGGIVLGIAIIFPLYQMEHSVSNKVSQLKTENSTLQRSMNAQQSRIMEARQLQAAITSAEATKQKLVSILEDFQQIGEHRQRAYDFLCLTSKHPPEGILPDEAELFSLSQGDGTLNLLGEASSYEVALEYADALRQTEGFSSVQLRSLTAANSKGQAVRFDISLEWK